MDPLCVRAFTLKEQLSSFSPLSRFPPPIPHLVHFDIFVVTKLSDLFENRLRTESILETTEQPDAILISPRPRKEKKNSARVCSEKKHATQVVAAIMACYGNEILSSPLCGAAFSECPPSVSSILLATTRRHFRSWLVCLAACRLFSVFPRDFSRIGPARRGIICSAITRTLRSLIPSVTRPRERERERDYCNPPRRWWSRDLARLTRILIVRAKVHDRLAIDDLRRFPVNPGENRTTMIARDDDE